MNYESHDTMASPNSQTKNTNAGDGSPRWLKRLVAWGCLGSLVAIFGAVAIVWWVIRSIQEVPEEYQTALEIPAAVAAQRGDELERSVLQLQRVIDQRQPWKIVITSEQINGWLASDLPQKFPDSTPNGVSQPRVVLEPNSARLLFQYQLPGDLVGIASIDVDLYLTDQHNELAIELREIKSGVVRLPVEPWLNALCASLQQHGIDARWNATGSYPVVLLTVPDRIEDLDREGRIVLESVQIGDGRLTIAGSSHQDASE